MKILHKSKRAVPPPAPVADLINRIQNTATDELASILTNITVWKWQRSDLNAWIKVLNKFDTILEELVSEYEIDQLQKQPFAPHKRALLSEILRFERLLLENSTNRKMYNSYDRLNSLLFTSDLDILILTLKLLLRPSQQYSAQPAVSQALSISTPRLQSLAKRWPQLREYGVSLVELAAPGDALDVEALPAESKDVNFTFYRTGTTPSSGKDKDKDNKAMDTDAPSGSSSSQSQQQQVGAVAIHVDEATLSTKGEMELLAELVEVYSVPDSEKFELLCRVRAAAVLKQDRQEDRQKLVIIRLLAIAIFGHTHPESQATASLFLYEPDLINHVAELLRTDKNIPVPVQTAAISALDALARYRSKMQEVLTSVNAGVNHGILMGLLRKTVSDISSADSKTPNSFVEALLSLISLLASHASGGNMVVGAGLIPLLIQILENKNAERLPVLSKTMQLIDNVLYSFQNAFTLFCSSRGVDVLVERIEFEITHNIKEHGDHQRSREIYGSHSEIPVARAAVLKHILRSMHRMMQSSGSSEGLRTLIDSSILKSIKKIIEYRGLFGASVLPIAINIMATFVHNEPTSLVVIQEAGLPESFYKAIELGLEPAIEVIQAIPYAIGALCLNEVGQGQLAARPSIIPSIFSIFTSDRHLKVLLEKENAVMIGTTIDELIRHHPQLKSSVFDAIKATLSKIEALGNAWEPPEDLRQWYRLTAIPVDEEDVTMADGKAEEATASSTSLPLAQSAPSVVPKADNKDDPATSKPHDNHIVSFIDVLGRFLEGLFQHAPHCKDFMATQDGMESLGRMTALPCLPYDYASSLPSDSMVQIMRTMTEASTSDTLLHLAKLVKESLAATEPFWTDLQNQSKLLQFVDLTPEEETNANFYFRNLVTLHIRITLLSDIFTTAGYAHGRQAIGLLQTLMTSFSPQVIKNLGALHRASIWENIVLKAGLVVRGLDNSPPLNADPAETLGADTAEAAVTPSVLPANGAASTAPGNSPEVPDTAPGSTEAAHITDPALPSMESSSQGNGPRQTNATALRHVTNGMPTALAPFFQATVKMFHARRAFDNAQRKQMSETSSVVAEILLDHLKVKPMGDIPSMFVYYSIIFGVMTVLLVDDRTQTNTLHTVQLLALYRANGFEVIFNVCQEFITVINALLAKPEGTRTEEEDNDLSHAFGALKVALNLMHPLVSAKPLFDSGQTPLLATRDVKDTDPEYFEAHNFLVRLRLASLPLLNSVWEADWLPQLPLAVSRAVVQTVLEVLNGENEEPKGEGDAPVIPGIPAARGPTGPDENRVRQLVDMGFPRSAVERALVRTHNNVNAATELLLAHPYPFPAEPEPEAVATESASPASTEAPLTEDAPMTEDAPSTGKSSEEWRVELNKAREPLREHIADQALDLVDTHLSLIFDLHSAFIKPAGPHQVNAVWALVQDIKTFSPEAYGEQEQPLANRCRLLALVLCETPSSFIPDMRAKLMANLLALLLSMPLNSQSPSIPRWLAAHLLVTEALFTLADEPKGIEIPKEGEDIVQVEVAHGPALTEARTIVFDFCLRLMALPELPSDELLSTLRLLVLLSRDHNVASQFVSRDGLNMLFTRLKASPVPGSASYIATILRHVIEDRSVVSLVMHQSIRRYFNQVRGRAADPPTFVRNCSSMVLRDPSIFLEMTQTLCQMSNPYASSPQVNLRPEFGKDAKLIDKVKSPEGEIQAEHALAPNGQTPTVTVDATVHFLINELMAARKASNEQAKASSEAADGGPTAPKKDYTQYMCFVMQCLTELMFSYDSCKTAFLSYPNKKSRPSSLPKEGKQRTQTLSFFLNELVTYETTQPQNNPETRTHMQICNWAMSVLVAICVDSSTAHEGKEIPGFLIGVRKTVLDAISRTIKDLPSTESTDQRYGRLLALGDLCHRLLTVRFNHTLNMRKQPDDGATHLAKIMLEKGFVGSLTNALAEVDLNYPNVRQLVNSIMRPMELLTKIAIKMSRATGKGKELAEETKSDSDESMESDEEEERANREETPDLYRHSALGIYGGEMETGNQDGDEMDGDEGDLDDEDEMDFGEETGSDDTSPSTDEEDEVMHEAGDWDGDEDDEDDEDEDEEDDLVHNEDDEDDEGEDDDEEIDGEDAEAMGEIDAQDPDGLWQDIEDVGEDGPEDEAEPEIAGPIHIIHEDEEDEPEMASDEDDIAQGFDTDLVGGVFGFGNLPPDPHNIFLPHRRRDTDENVQIFGRARNAGGNAPPEATTHPLLLDQNAARSQPRMARPPPGRGVMSDGGDILQTIEQLVGGGAFQFFQHIMTRGRGGTETIRLDVPQAALMDLDRAAGFPLQRRNPVISASVRVERNGNSNAGPPAGRNPAQGRDLEPLLTLQRWAEEVKILHGDFVAERSSKIANHVILKLLPEAVEAARLAKIKEEEKAQAEAEAAAKAEAKAKADEEAKVKAEEEEEAKAKAQAELTSADQQMEDAAATPSASQDSDAEMADGTTTADVSVPPPDPEEAGPSITPAAPSRVTVSINGNEVDITDTGIDPTFLEALPDDMREEVINQHVREQRAAQVERPPDSHISTEFLDALPPELRAEIIQQEAVERSNQRRTNAAVPANTTGPIDIDPASFIASLDPTLRQAILMDQDDGFIQSLPSHMIAEAGAIRDSQPNRLRLSSLLPGPPRPGLALNSRKTPTAQHDAIQLLDRPAIASLVRMLFFPQIIKKNLLFKVLLNLCENSKTRTELFNLLLSILQDGTGDLSAVDKSFSQMSFRNQKSPKVAGKQKSTADLSSVLAIPTVQNDAVPELIAQRCLDALVFIVSANSTASLFFLTEHEVPVGLRKSSGKKGKGKEKQMPQAHYPVVLLLSLLDRQPLLRTASVVESIVGLLATVTRPLSILKESKRLAAAAEASTLAADQPPAPVVPSDEAAAHDTTSVQAPSANAPTPSATPAAAMAPTPASTTAPPAAGSSSGPEPPTEKIESLEQKILVANPPQIPHTVLRYVVNILTIGECSSRTFQQSLALIQHLSNIADARDVIAQELKTKAQEFGQLLLADLDELAKALSVFVEDELNAVASKFSAPSSVQAKLLRVLKTIDYMYTPRPTERKEGNDEDSEKVQSIYESFRFTPLWRRLGDCLAIIEGKKQLEHVATVLLPLIEALMVVCKYVGPKSAAAKAQRAISSPRSPTSPAVAMEDLFVSFTDDHRKILNLMVRNNPSLMSGSFSLLVHNPRVLDFDNKRNYFSQQLHRRPHGREHHGTIQLNIRRARVFEDSFQHMQRKTGDQIKYGKLSIRFYEEEGVDAGGLTREWFQILARQMFDPNNALFQPCAADKLTYQPNKNSWVNPEHLSFFKFVGRVIGKAIYDGRLLDAYFARSLYRQILGKQVDYRDVEWVDPEYYNSLCWILENDPELLELNFSVEADEFGVNRTFPLKEGGEAITVTNENKREFVQLSAQFRLYSSIKQQIEHLLTGFYEIIPKDLVSIFNEQELELLISGTPDIDVDEWRAATEYNGYTSSDPNIVWWWRALKSFNREERAKVLSFATGTSRVPLNGFNDLQGVQGVQKFSIHRAYGQPDRLPQAHTCFNQIDLPQYSSYDMLRQQLLLAIREGGEGFGFV